MLNVGQTVEVTKRKKKKKIHNLYENIPTTVAKTKIPKK